MKGYVSCQDCLEATQYTRHGVGECKEHRKKRIRWNRRAHFNNEVVSSLKDINRNFKRIVRFFVKPWTWWN